MNYGPLIFLAAFLALSASWFGFVLGPQVQLGREQQGTNLVNQSELYPFARPGMARQGREVYRANGCFYCHSQQVGQTATVGDVILWDAGTNAPAAAEAFAAAHPDAKVTAAGLAAGLPKTILKGARMDLAYAVAEAMRTVGAKVEAQVVPVGPDIARGWGKRRTVAADFLFDYPVMPGSLRAGPDLANVGVRLPDVNWHLRHLYAPRAEVKDSTMPSYEFLFELRRISGQPSPDALVLPSEFAPPSGYEIVPKPEAKQLVAYLMSLHMNVPLYEAPLTVPAPPPAPGQTNAAATGQTNAAATGQTNAAATGQTNGPAQ